MKDQGDASIKLTELSSKDDLYCGRFTTDSNPQPRAFTIAGGVDRKIATEPETPSSLDLASADANCAAGVALAGATLTPQPGCGGISDAAAKFDAASNFIESIRKTCAGAKPISLER